MDEHSHDEVAATAALIQAQNVDLTDEQSAAVTHPNGRPARVLAGAGTGKTRVIVARFHHLVGQGARPDRILVLTFSRPAAAQLREEILKGLTATGRLWVSTFHSFCLRILSEELGEAPRLVQEPEARAILASLMPQADLRTTQEAHAFIGQAKDQLLTPAQIRSYAQAAGDARLAGLSDLYQQFQHHLQTHNEAEFADYIYTAVELLRSNDIAAARWQDRFDHVLVDEFQDTNTAQFEVLKALTARHGNLFVVGDDDQAIYRFRGATDHYMRHLPDLLGKVADYPIRTNFRCPAPVIEGANRLIGRNAPHRVEKWLRTETKLTGFPPIAHWEAPTEREEADAVATEIHTRITQGGSPKDFAILLRSVRRSAGEFARALTERGVPFRILGEEAPHPVITQTMALLRHVAGAATRDDLLAVAAALKTPADLYELNRSGSDLPELNAWLPGKASLPLDQLVYEALLFLGHLSPTQDRTRIEAARALTDGAAAAGTLANLLQSTIEAQTTAGGGVAIMTIHAAKGLQFPVVFVSGLVEGRFPVDVDASPAYYITEAIQQYLTDGHVHAPSATDRLAQHLREERRLAYVALTRAEQELILTRARSYGGEPALPSRFLAELGAPEARHTQPAHTTGAARAYLLGVADGAERPHPDRLTAAARALKDDPTAVPIRKQAAPVPFTGADSLRLSASALETYRDCPRRYYYAYVLGLPEEDNIYTSFGSALHAVLEAWGKDPAKSWPQVEALWNDAIKPDDYESQAQFRQLRDRGRIFLHRYYLWAAANPREIISVEGAFQIPYVDGKGRSHTIRGRYDLIVRGADGQEEIVDFKSGTRTSTGVNKRPTKGSEKNPDRKLQLGLYYLARHGGAVKPGAKVTYIFLRHPDDKPPRHFVEGFNEGGEQVISCEHTAQSLAVIRETIDGVIDGILTNDFTRKPDDWKCSNCPFKDPCEVSRRAYF